MELNQGFVSLIHVITLEALRESDMVVKKMESFLNAKVEEDEFTELVCNHQDEMYRIAYCYMRNKEEALDIVGDAIYKAYTNMKKLKKKEYFKTWIIRILINTANTALRKRECERKIMSFIRPHKVQGDKELEMDIRNVVQNLDSKSKDIIILKYYNDYTTKNISEILSIPEGTVKSNLNRTLKKLKITLSDGEYENKGGELSYERSN